MALQVKVNGSRASRIQAVVGQRLDLEVVSSDGNKVVNPKWNVPGAKVVSDFKMAKRSTRKDLVTAWNSTTLSLCPTAVWDNKILVEGSVSGVRKYKKIGISVVKPQVVSFQGTTGEVDIGTVVSDLGDSNYLSFGGFKSTGRPGITWTAKLVGARYCGGSYGFVQTMSIDRKKSLRRTVREHLTSQDDWVLDEDIFYGTEEIAIYDNTIHPVTPEDEEPPPFVEAPLRFESTAIRGEDSPGTPIFTKWPDVERFRFDKVEINESFRTYLMYRAAPASLRQSVWISIARLDWYWEATATWTGSAWRLDEKDWRRNPRAILTVEFPEWKGNRCDIMRQ